MRGSLRRAFEPVGIEARGNKESDSSSFLETPSERFEHGRAGCNQNRIHEEVSIIQYSFDFEVQDQLGREKFRVLVAHHANFRHGFQISHDFMGQHAIENEDQALWNFG